MRAKVVRFYVVRRWACWIRPGETPDITGLPSPFAALPAAWPRATVAGSRRSSSALARGISRPVALSLTGGTLACPVPRPTESSGLSVGLARLTGGITATRTLAVSILVEAAARLSQGEVGCLPLRGLALGSGQRRTNERPMNGAVVFEQIGRLGFRIQRFNDVRIFAERLVRSEDIARRSLRLRRCRPREGWRSLRPLEELRHRRITGLAAAR